MITKENFKKTLEFLGFKEENNIFTKKFDAFECELKVDFQNEILIYPENKGFTVNERQTCNFKANENFVVFECVYRLLNQGYNPAHIELEPKWQVGHGASGGRADILVKDNDDKSLLIIECKTAGAEFTKAWNTTQTKPTQLFSYVQQTRTTQFIALYASDFVDSQVVSNYYLINVSDNDELLKNNPKLQSFKDASTVGEIYKVWSDTYGKDFATLGLFEDNKAYDIGKTKFTSNDLKNINSKDIQGKYHEFATILRQHNVSGRENAFDKLVNLFLCKVVDEKENAGELKFYWKGKAYDNPFDFQDRLQQLYKNGMEKFLGETITYIDNHQIDEAFEVFKNKTNETKTKIKEFLRAQKFFTNNDFAFIDVHNEKLFYQNFEVLLKISRLIQDISLTGSDENQFLGDMFEGFLDQGVKQSEGQFFTPMPIVKFIINSLPQKQKPKVIDYACGAGHFLNEYALTNNEAKIIGIEKEYRLSKVAKVSSFMYGSEIDIIYADALCKSEKIRENSFDVLVANPPYSVKGFLETLSDDDRNRYELLQTVEEKSYTANNAIECFFIERAKQLLVKNGVAGIIVPSSILNKGAKNNVYVATREILLKYFDIVAIAEFGSGTFGKTGTNTVTLFLKRRGDNPDLAEHFKNMVECWFECDFETNKAFEDDGLLEHYCSHIEVDFEMYKTLLCQNLDEKIFEKDTFKEYKNEFEKLTETKNRRKTRTYATLTKEQKEESEKSELTKYIRLIEKDKFYYFCLASKNSCDVVIVKSPSDGKENKKFLGYEWSSAKGNEGIHYLSSSVVAVEDESLDEEDKRILENLAGLKSINTPLYNPSNSDDKVKINKIIKDNFDGIKTIIPTELEPFVSRTRLVDMLDFSRVDFNKALSLTPSKKVEIESQYPLVKIETIITKLINGSTPSKTEDSYWNSNDINWLTTPDFSDEKIYILNTSQFVSKKAFDDKKVSIIPINSVVLTCTATIGKVGVTKIELTTNQQINSLMCDISKVIPEFLAYFLKTQKENLENLTSNSGVKHINMGMLNNFKIPLPPLEIQEEIVKECQKVDDEVLKANETIGQSKVNIILAMNSSSEYTPMKLGDACDMKAGKFVSASDIYDENDG
ncbi:MAG: N-6 DNA methylase, partial [Sulfurovum sp.]